MLEAMSRAAADEQHIFQSRVQIDQEVAVRAILVLADLRADHLRASKCRKAAVAELDDLRERGGGGTAILRVGIDLYAMLIVRNLGAAALEVGKAVKDVAAVEVCPARHCAWEEAAIPRRDRKVENLLPCREDLRADHVRKQLGQPRAERKYETVSL